jgi:hypothetical protein
MKKSTYKKALYNQALPHIAAQFDADKDLEKFQASVLDMIEKADRAWKAVKCPTWSDASDVGSKTSMNWYDEVGRTVDLNLNLLKDWSTASLEDVPKDWMPDKNELTWYISKGNSVDSTKRVTCFRNTLSSYGLVYFREGNGRLFPTERIAKLYLESLQEKPKERWKPEVGEKYWIFY